MLRSAGANEYPAGAQSPGGRSSGGALRAALRPAAPDRGGGAGGSESTERNRMKTLTYINNNPRRRRVG